MPPRAFDEQLLAASPRARRRLIERRPVQVGEAEVHAIAEQARAAATSDPAESQRLAEIAQALAEALGAPRGRALALRALGVALRAQARWAEAVGAFEEGARLAEAAGDPLLAAQIPIAATEALAQLGRHDEGIALARSLEERLRAQGAEEDAAKVLANCGNVYFEREEYAPARDCYEQALDYFVARGQQVPAARLRMNLANILVHLSRFPEAVAMYESARSQLAAAGMEVLVGSTDLNVGFLRFTAGQYTEALQVYERAHERFSDLGLVKETAVCERETADVHLELNLVPEARAAYERVIPVFADLRMAAQVARAEMGLALALAAEGRAEEALEVLARAERAFAREGNPIGVARTRLQRAEWWRRVPPAGQPPRSSSAFAASRREATAALRTFRAHGVRIGELQARLQLAEMRAETGGGGVRSLHCLVREIEAAAFVSLLWRAEAALARASLHAGRQRAAVAHYRRAVEAVERLRRLLRGDDFRIAFLHDKTCVYEELTALLLDRGSPAALSEAFQVAERAKSRTLLELLAGAIEHRSLEGPGRQRLRRRLDALRAELNWDYGRLELIDGAARLPPADAALPERVREVEREYVRTQRQLQLIGVPGDVSSAAGDLVLPRVAELQALLGADEQLVEYVTTRDEVLAFVLDRRRFRTVRCLASRAEVEQQVARLRFQWSKFGPAGYARRHACQLAAATRQVLGNLYDMLLEPLESLLFAERLTVIPHGVLHSIPFHALAGDGDYALDRWEFAYAPSAAVWRACRLRQDPEADGALIYGVADPEIAHVRDEIAALRGVLPGAEVYEDEAATLAAVPTDRACRYLHFATHAVFRHDNPLFSGLRMADGWLIANDLYRRRLECRLATLSACRTGVSQVAPGDEVLGLARGFLHAGARAVLVSLWSADDVATAELMPACYAGMAAGMSRAAALRAAQRSLRERHPHPYHWAPFALVGAR